MDYKVVPKDKLVCVWTDEASEEELDEYRRMGYRIAYFMRGHKPIKDVLRAIVLPSVGC